MIFVLVFVVELSGGTDGGVDVYAAVIMILILAMITRLALSYTNDGVYAGVSDDADDEDRDRYAMR